MNWGAQLICESVNAVLTQKFLGKAALCMMHAHLPPAHRHCFSTWQGALA